MTPTTSVQVLSFDNFAALETHLRALRSKYNDSIKKYEELLGSMLRDSRPADPKSQKNQERWTREMQHVMAPNEARPKDAKQEAGRSIKLFGGGKDKEKEKHGPGSGDWISLEPVSIFVGQKNRGMAELYFDTINMLKETVGKINLAMSICQKLKAKAPSAGSTALVVSFVNDTPHKIVLRTVDFDANKKYSMNLSLRVPAATPLKRPLAAVLR